MIFLLVSIYIFYHLTFFSEGNKKHFFLFANIFFKFFICNFLFFYFIALRLLVVDLQQQQRQLALKMLHLFPTQTGKDEVPPLKTSTRELFVPNSPRQILRASESAFPAACPTRCSFSSASSTTW